MTQVIVISVLLVMDLVAGLSPPIVMAAPNAAMA